VLHTIIEVLIASGQPFRKHNDDVSNRD
jgi:hypothetical protein